MAEAFTTSMLTPRASRLSRNLLWQATIPMAWKGNKITPLYKKGFTTSTCNYRTFTVSGALYRLYS
eukprot:scaffold84800_cov13-Tisochrysis_lutea.AAC.1